MKNKREAWDFFSDLQKYLTDRIPTRETIRTNVSEIVESAKKSVDQRHKAFPEGAFLNHYIAPGISSFLREECGLTESAARHALLSESFRRLAGIASASPARAQPHPFKKALGIKARDIIDQWQGNSVGNPLVQSCPDLALRPPAPVATVIEGKFFSKGSHRAAATSLANDIYQAFFYLGLSDLPETISHPAWQYDYSCLLACDATEQGSLVSAWESFSPSVRDGIWDGANVFVMVLRR